jgi:hypothetical protein
MKSAGDLIWFVGQYVPRGWRFNISNVAFVPNWIYNEYDNLSNGMYNKEPKWYEREAIEAYFGRVANAP